MNTLELAGVSPALTPSLYLVAQEVHEVPEHLAFLVVPVLTVNLQVGRLDQLHQVIPAVQAYPPVLLDLECRQVLEVRWLQFALEDLLVLKTIICN